MYEGKTCLNIWRNGKLACMWRNGMAEFVRRKSMPECRRNGMAGSTAKKQFVCIKREGSDNVPGS